MYIFDNDLSKFYRQDFSLATQHNTKFQKVFSPSGDFQ